MIKEPVKTQQDTKPKPKQNSHHHYHDQQKKLHLNSSSSTTHSKPQRSSTLPTASSLPSKPQINQRSTPGVKQPVWAAIAGKKPDETKNLISKASSTTSTTNSSITSTKNNTPSPNLHIPTTSNDSKIRDNNDQGRKESNSSLTLSSDSKPHASLNDFNSLEISNYLSFKASKLSQKSVAFKDTGSAWVVKLGKSKKDSKPGEDVVSHALTSHIKKVLKKEQKEHNSKENNDKSKDSVKSDS